MLTKGFVTGVNYWASNAGIKMWSDFDEAVIDSDFKKLAEVKMDVVRLFPLWSEFQPVRQLYRYGGGEVDVRYLDDTLPPDTEVGRAGMSEEMLCRFEKVLRLAEKHGLKVAVGLLTGWMSGRLFVPPILEGKNLLTNVTANRMATDFIRVFVNRFKNEDVIVGWTSGNETDCLARASLEEKELWAVNMRNAIRAADPTRPIMDDMHPMRTSGTDSLNSRRDIFDATTVHPYILFSPYCPNEPVTSMRGLLHAVAEAKAQEGISKTPCLIEEIGTLGDFFCSREISGGYAKVNLYSAWANGMTGMMWWCANEQVELKYPPYSWNPLERELGVFDIDGNQKPVAVAFKEFKENISALPFEITPAKTDAVCILNGGVDDWAKILGSYVLSKQAGFNIEFAHQSSIPQSDMYILPSLYDMPEGSRFDELLSRVEKGATLVMTFGSGLLYSSFEQITGNKLITYATRSTPLNTSIGSFKAPTKIVLEPTASNVLIFEEDGTPFITEHNYGKGKVIFCTAPVERQYSETVGEPDSSLTEVYKIIAGYINLGITRTKGCIGITNHTLADGTKIAVAINYSANEVTDTLNIEKGEVGKVYIGSVKGNEITLAPYSAAVFEVK